MYHLIISFSHRMYKKETFVLNLTCVKDCKVLRKFLLVVVEPNKKKKTFIKCENEHTKKVSKKLAPLVITFKFMFCFNFYTFGNMLLNGKFSDVKERHNT